MAALGPLRSSQRSAGASQTLRQAGSLLAPWRRLLALVALLIVAAAALELVPPLLVRQLVDEHLSRGDRSGLLRLALLYLGAQAAVEGTGFLAAYLTAVAAQGALHRLRVRLFAHLQRLPLGFYDRTPLGDVISRCTADVETVDTLFSSGVAKLVGDLVRLVTAGAAMVALSPPLALVAGLTVPPLVVTTNAFRRGVRDAERANRRAVGDLNTQLHETLGGVEVLRAFAREDAFVARFWGALRASLAAFNRSTFYAALYPPVMNILAAVAIALLLWAGTRERFAAWQISLGTLTGFVLLFQRFFAPITALGDEWQTVQSALSGVERIFQVLALPAEEPPEAPREEAAEEAPDGATRPDAGASSGATPKRRGRSEAGALVAVRHLVFGYLPDHPVVRGVSLEAHPGEHVALVGRTGAGKSSVLHLLGGLYAPWAGTVRVAGCDPRALPADARRRIVGAVPQVVHLFSGTVRENLTLGDPDVPDDAVRRAAQTVGADAFIGALPREYETPIASAGRGGGVQLSTGQRQLLALARALVWEPRVLLLDEATAAVDGASDAAFRAGLRRGVLARGGAVVSVAHRLSTAREADRVIVMEAGRVVEEGAPAALLRRGGQFAALVDLEAAGWDWRAAPPATTMWATPDTGAAADGPSPVRPAHNGAMIRGG
jgi:ATP-binding cassette subfamily B protein